MGAPVIDELLFPSDISRGAQFGPTFSTIVIETVAGTEVRVAEWLVARHRGSIQLDQRTPAQMAAVKAFFLARTGRARGFRFQDWSDYVTTNEPLIPQPPVNAAVGSPTIQLIKTYADSVVPYVRNIAKPKSSPAVTMLKNGSSFAGFSLDTTTGLATLTALNTKSITAITQANPVVITVGASHGFVVNDLVYVSGVAGMTQINGQVGAVTATGATTITLGSINSTTYSAYTSGGTAAKYLTTTDTLTWTGQFDVPVRFDTDDASGMTQEDVAILTWDSIPVVELLS